MIYSQEMGKKGGRNKKGGLGTREVEGGKEKKRERNDYNYFGRKSGEKTGGRKGKNNP